MTRAFTKSDGILLLKEQKGSVEDRAAHSAGSPGHSNIEVHFLYTTKNSHA